MRANLQGDRGLLACTALLVGFGLLMIGSSSSILALKGYGDTLYFFKRQLCWVVLGVAGLVIFAGISLDFLRRTANYFGLISLLLLIIVLIPGVGLKAHEAQRWIRLGSFSLQPSEFAKFGLIIFLAANLSRRYGVIRDLKVGVGPYYVLMAVVFMLVYAQPDFGTAIIMCSIIYLMLFLTGAKFSHLMLPFLATPLLFYFCVKGSEYRWQRILAFLDPFHDPQGGGFQIIQSFIALGSGGIYGVGLGDSAQKLFYLPEPHTDFIFSIVGEEFGIIGTIIVLLLFIYLFLRGLAISKSAPDLHSFLLASGVVVMITGQILMNLGVVTGLLPTKGTTLPFVSYGGSSLVVNLSMIGLLWNISKVAEESKYS